MARWGRRAAQVDILVVCTGNVCRSPTIERMLAASLPLMTISSAGTAAVVGAPVPDFTEAALRARGLTAEQHRARQLTPGAVATATLIVTATRAHRTHVIQLVPAAVERTYTLKELARLVEAAGATGQGEAPTTLQAALRDLVASAASALYEDPADQHDDLADPIGLPPEAFQRCADECADAVWVIIASLHRRTRGILRGPP